MDPNTTLKRWFDAMEDRAIYEANNAYEDLRHWLRFGGFEPAWTPEMRRDFFDYSPRTGKVER